MEMTDEDSLCLSLKVILTTLGLILWVRTYVCMQTCQHWEIQKWLFHNLTVSIQMSLPVQISWHHKQREWWASRSAVWALKRRASHLFPATQIPHSGADNIWGKDSESIDLRTTSFVQDQADTHHAVFAYANTCIYAHEPFFFPKCTKID